MARDVFGLAVEDRSPAALERRALDLIERAVQTYKPRAVVALFSGGTDSLTAATIASQHPAFTGAAHMNTGIGIEATREFVRGHCRREGWKFWEMRAKEDAGQDYEALVLKHGFPGSAHHYKMYDRLKDRPLRLLTKRLKKGRRDKILLVSGGRSSESVRRMGHVEPIQVRGIRVWVAPLHDWSKKECHDYLEWRGVRRNPVADMIHMSGECLCGAFARENELEEIRFFFPEEAEQIDALQRKVAKHGTRAAKARCFWGRSTVNLPLLGKPPEPGKANGRDGPKRVPGPMCVGCAGQREFWTTAAASAGKEGDQ